jgi:hypothetical protein
MQLQIRKGVLEVTDYEQEQKLENERGRLEIPTRYRSEERTL